MLPDFKPVSLPTFSPTKIDRATFYVIDVHSHVNDAARIDAHAAGTRRRDDGHNNVRTIVILIGLWRDKLQSTTRS